MKAEKAKPKNARRLKIGDVRETLRLFMIELGVDFTTGNLPRDYAQVLTFGDYCVRLAQSDGRL